MPAARLILTFLALFAFTVQSYVTQTHLHVPGHAGVTAFFDFVQIEKADTHDGKAPQNLDQANCPLCQQSGIAGNFVVPAVLLLVLPAYAALGFVVFSEPIAHILTPSHNWQGRAPPEA